MNLSRLIAKLETTGPRELTPALKAWLGWELTDTGRAALDSSERKVLDPATSDTGERSPELETWLGLSEDGR